MAAKKQTLATALLDAVLNNVSYSSPAAVYVALYTTAPTATTQGTEVTTAGGTLYARTAAVFDPAAAGATSNNGAIAFPAAGASWGNVKAAAICSGSVAGVDDQLYFGLLGTAKDVGIGDVLNFADGALTVSET